MKVSNTIFTISYFSCFLTITLSYNFYNNIVFHDNNINLTNIVSNIQENQVLLVNAGNIGMPKIVQLPGLINKTINNTKISPSIFIYNGGIPQLMNYTLYSNKLTSFLTTNKLPNKSDEEQYKFIVFDMEDWFPVWDICNDFYKNATIAYVQDLYNTTLDQTELLHKAKESWQSSSLKLMIDAIEHARTIYPKSLIGYYGYPSMPYWGNSSAIQQSQEHNDQMNALWQQVDVLLPSIYIPYVTSNIEIFYENWRYIGRKALESIRIRNNLNKSGFDNIPIVFYTWYKYHSGQPILNYQDTYLEFVIPWFYHKYGVDGCILWGNEGNDEGDKLATEYFIEYAGLFEKFS